MWYQGNSPYIETFRNRLEMFNEWTVLCCTLHMMTFTDWVPDVDAQYTMGWSMIGVLVANFAVNLSVILHVVFKLGSLISKKYYKLIRHKLFPNELKRKKLREKYVRELEMLVEQRDGV
jgi:hypothetical protein